MSTAIADQRASSTKGTRNVDCISNTRFLGVVDRNNCHVHGRYKSGRSCRSAAFDRKTGAKCVPVEGKAFAIETDSRGEGCHSLNGAIFWLRLVSRTCVLFRSEMAMLPRRGPGDLGKVLNHGRSRRHVRARTAIRSCEDGNPALRFVTSTRASNAI